MKTLLLLYVGTSALLVLISLPLIMRKIKPNPFYGFRTRQTLEDPELWYSVNELFARHLLIAGLLQIFASIAFYLIPGISVDVYALACLGVFVIFFSYAMSKSLQFIRSTKKSE